MNGTNGLDELDRNPLPLCPQCVAKVWWGSSIAPEKRFGRLAEYCTEHGLKPEALYYRQAERTLALE